MAKQKEILGHLTCECCGGEADVMQDKNGFAYTFCLGCPGKPTQKFSRCAENDAMMRKRMRPVAAPPGPPKPVEKPAPSVSASPVGALTKGAETEPAKPKKQASCLLDQ